MRIVPGLGSHVGIKTWMLFTGAVFIRIHCALRTRLLQRTPEYLLNDYELRTLGVTLVRLLTLLDFTLYRC